MPFVTPTYPPPGRRHLESGSGVEVTSSGVARGPSASSFAARYTTQRPNDQSIERQWNLAVGSASASGAHQQSRSAARDHQQQQQALPPQQQSRGSPSRQTAFTIYMRPIYRPAIVDLVRHYGWTRIYYLYDSPEGKHSLAAIEVWRSCAFYFTTLIFSSMHCRRGIDGAIMVIKIMQRKWEKKKYVIQNANTREHIRFTYKACKELLVENAVFSS